MNLGGLLVSLYCGGVFLWFKGSLKKKQKQKQNAKSCRFYFSLFQTKKKWGKRSRESQLCGFLDFFDYFFLFIFDFYSHNARSPNTFSFCKSI